MVFALLRMMAAGFVVLTVLYFTVSLYSRSVRREKLEKEWDEEGMQGDRDAFIEKGMAEYHASLRKKLIWLIYVVPVVAGLVTFYLINFY